MSNEQEAQQAQTIAEIIKWRDDNRGRVINDENSVEIIDTLINHRQKLLGIVDSRAQKIAHLEHKKQRVFEICDANIKWQRKQRGIQAQKIAEQAKEIEKLNTQIRLMEYRYAEMGDLDYNEPDWLARLKSLSPDGKP